MIKVPQDQARLPRTLYEKIWDAHIVKSYGANEALLYIDQHLVQEVSSPQAFEGLKRRRINLRRPLAHLATPDHAVSTDKTRPNLKNSLAAAQLNRLLENTTRYGLPYLGESHPSHGIVHVIGPELGFTLPGSTLVCGDSHTSTHGAFGALAFGIGSSQCEAVFAAQSIPQKRLKTMRIWVSGGLGLGVTVKDLVLSIIAKIGTDGARGYAVEYAGDAVASMSMEERMTLCNMTIEAGGRVGLIAPDETTFQYLEGRPLAPTDALWEQALTYWKTLPSDADAQFDKELTIDASSVAPHVTWGTNPAQCAPVTEYVPDPAEIEDSEKRHKYSASLAYMDLVPNTPLSSISIDRVFIGSCTNGRLEDLRAAAAIIKGRKVSDGVTAMVVPGSATVQVEAEKEGLDHIFANAGFEWRSAGCSMCVAMNEDRLKPGERCASTSNRNFEGRQGVGGRTHLVSPVMAAAAAITGRLTDVRTLQRSKL